MKVSQLKQACESFISRYGDSDVLLCWEEGAISEGFDITCLEEPSDVRAVPDWPLPGNSFIVPSESPDYNLVIFYKEREDQF